VNGGLPDGTLLAGDALADESGIEGQRRHDGSRTALASGTVDGGLEAAQFSIERPAALVLQSIAAGHGVAD
jgi:hypothetical protein